MIKLRLLVIAAVTLVSASEAFPHVFHYAAILSGADEFPANTSPGVGTALVTVDEDELTMEVNVSFSGLDGLVNGANIHAATEMPLAGTADIATMVPTFPEFPESVAAGTYDEEFNLGVASTYNPAFITTSGGTVSNALGALIFALDEGKAYFNIRTTAFPDGEIRGFLVYMLGDYNHDLVVNAADYTLWRDSLGQIGEGLDADSNHDNVVNDLDYDAWQENFGHDSSSLLDGRGGVVAVPEPHALILLAVGVAIVGRSRRT